MVPKDVPLHFICESDSLGTVLCNELDRWEGVDWRGISNREAWKAITNVLRQRCAVTTFRKANSKTEWDLMERGRSVATQLTRIGTLHIITPLTDPRFNLSGVKILDLSQRLAYRIIRSKKAIYRKATQRNLDSIIETLRRCDRHETSAQEIWISLKSKDLRKNVADFLWKCVHNAHRCGTFWKNIQGYEDRVECTYCGVPETMKHIMTECQAPGRDVIWDLAGTLWNKKQAEWTRPSYEEIIAVGLKEWYTPKLKRRPLAERFWRIMISESAYMIWCLRCERTIRHEPDQNWVHTTREISARWSMTMNRRLHLEMAMTHRRYGRLALKKDTVLGTWRGTLADEHALPDDWTGVNRVLVGIAPFVSDAQGEG
ncbi:uncharacterized protein C8Q71DRAFT_715060 [Rhodofomes roseus]|uniref:Reverse transcriptase zinc-binding domain-containing protein n=1 Tax=Rhodofomes roseus TaxID=34475 RepID=A0ABQ8K470_9APHY|nr:uncharacterized protein C8Q71DRAFT_715060 [Rhodofomes roseus]KAH9831666.1 hypothetical protein C8Q71DRAFT_715060 [Rhodofomes roseus]